MKIISMLLSLTMFTSCLMIGGSEGEKFQEVPDFLGKDVQFSDVLNFILIPHCLKCHSQYANEKDFIGTRIIPGKPYESRVYNEIASGNMPKGESPLGTEKLELMEKYILSLKLETTNPPVKDPVPNDPPVELVTFEELKSEFLQPNNCLLCHSWAGLEEGVLSRVVKGKPEESSIYIEVESENMPKGGPPVSLEDLDLLRRYISGLK